jgi:ElaA protein
MEWHLKSFEELDTKTLYYILKLRAEVFVVEQTCPYLDPDDKDFKSHHLYATGKAGEVLAYARIVKPGVSYPTPAIGRVVTSPKIRKSGTGRILMQKCIQACSELFPGNPVTISAQCYLEKFYQSLGFETVSDPYPEDDIPHVKMLLREKAKV